MEIKHITELEALEFVKKQNHKDKWHDDFHMWRKHLIILANKWPQLKQFYRGAGKWLGYFLLFLLLISIMLSLSIVQTKLGKRFTNSINQWSNTKK